MIYALFLGICVLIVKGLTLVSGQMTDLFPAGAASSFTARRMMSRCLPRDWMQAHNVPVVVRAPVLNQARHVPELWGTA